MDVKKAAMKELDEAVTACQVAAYDKYRTELGERMAKRAADLADIKKMIEEEEAAKPAPGTKGWRCEKALSLGTRRPKRITEVDAENGVCGAGLCCGAARVWMAAGDAADAAWRTIESCQDAAATDYVYRPPRLPMSTELSPLQTVDFMCIEGAKKLAAAASAVAAAVYMLA